MATTRDFLHPHLVCTCSILLHPTWLVLYLCMSQQFIPQNAVVQWRKTIWIVHQKELDDDYLLETVGDICRFILFEVIHKSGRFHDRSSAIGRQPNCRLLREWENLKFCRWFACIHNFVTMVLLIWCKFINRLSRVLYVYIYLYKFPLWAYNYECTICVVINTAETKNNSIIIF